MRALHRILELDGGSGSLDVDAHDVFDYDPDLYNKMVRYPLEVLAIFDIVLMDMVARINPLFEKHIQTRIFNLKSSVSMRNLNPSGIIELGSYLPLFTQVDTPLHAFRLFWFHFQTSRRWCQ